MPVATATVTDLQRRGTQIIAELEATGKEVVIFKKGLPVAVLRPWTEKDILLAEHAGKEGKHGKR